MSTLREQFSAARKAQVEIQLDFVRNFTSNVVDSTGKLVALNLNTGRSSLEKSAQALRKLVTAQSPRDLADLTAQSQSGFDTLVSYSSELFDIASRAQANLIKAATPAVAAPSQALRALPAAEVEVEVQAEVQPAAPVEAAAVAPAVQAAAEAQPQAEAQPVQTAAPAIEIADEVPLPGHALKADTLAEAVSAAVGEVPPPVLDAAPLAVSAPSQVSISGIEPVDAAPPHAPVSGNPLSQDKADTPAPKSRRRK